MSVTIGRLHVRASVPRRLHGRAPDAVRLAREVMPAAASRRLAGRLPRRPSVCLIRRLTVRLRLQARQLTEAAIADAWAEAFCAALLTAMNQPPSGSLVALDSVEEWIAAVAEAVLEGRRLSEWPFDQFRALDGMDVSGSIRIIVRDTAADWPAVLQILDRRGSLGRLLAALGPSGCRDVFEAIADRTDRPPVATVADLVTIGRALLGDPVLYAGLRSESIDAVVIRWIAAAADGGKVPPFSPRALRAAVEALLWIANRPATSTFDWHVAADALPYGADAPSVLALVRSLFEPAAGEVHDAAARAALRQVLAQVADPSRVADPWTEAHDSAIAGLLFLVPVVDRLGWPEQVRRSALGAKYGSRALTYVLAGAATAIAGELPSAVTRFDPAVPIFSGWLRGADPDALRQLCRDEAAATRQELIETLCGESGARDASTTWDATFVRLGSRLLREFAGRLRGLSRSSDRFLVERTVAVPGTVTVGERVIVANLRPQPLWPALHVSGADTPLDSVTWMDGRRLEFRLEGL
jgi:hypothetical protein